MMFIDFLLLVEPFSYFSMGVHRNEYHHIGRKETTRLVADLFADLDFQ